MFRPAALAALTSLSLAMPTAAQDRTARIDSIFASITPATPGCAVGVSQRGKVVVNRAYGLANVERRVPLSQTSLFDIGSTQKQFTAASILLLVEGGRLSLSDDIRKYLPELPDYGHKVTVDHLLTHTAGIRDWTGLLPMAPEGTDVLALIHRQRGLNFVPGEEWAYSSSGFELAKEIVARVSGMSFADFTRKRLFEPLGMKSSAYVPDILQAGSNAALGYQKEGDGWKQYMRLGNNRGGGALVSTVGDLVVWTDALATGKLGSFVTSRIKEPARLANGRQLKYARGLMIDSTPAGLLVSHSGGAAGFSTWMGHFPEHALSVAVSCNFDPVSATALAGRVSELYLPRSPRPAPPAADVAGVDVSGRAGLWFDERTGDPMRLMVSDGRLRIANGPLLVAVSPERFRPARPDLFFRSQDAFEITFPSNDRLELRSVVGRTDRYRRAGNWAPTVADIQAVDGRYESAELGSVFEIVPGNGAITMRFERSPEKALELTPVERDTYMLRMMIVRFRRDPSGKVVGFDYGNPVVRNIAFTRLGERAAKAVASATPPAPPATSGGLTAATAKPDTAAPKLDGLAGDYELAPGRSLTVTLESGRLHGQPPGGEKRALTHVSGTTFAAEGAPVTLTFTLGADGRATAAVMRQNGRERTLPKVR